MPITAAPGRIRLAGIVYIQLAQLFLAEGMIFILDSYFASLSTQH